MVHGLHQVGAGGDVDLGQPGILLNKQLAQLGVVVDIQRGQVAVVDIEGFQLGVLADVDGRQLGMHGGVEDLEVLEELDALQAGDGVLLVLLVKPDLLGHEGVVVQIARAVGVEVLADVIAEGGIGEVRGVDLNDDGRWLGRDGRALVHRQLGVDDGARLHISLSVLGKHFNIFEVLQGILVVALRSHAQHVLSGLDQQGVLGDIQGLDAGALHIQPGQRGILAEIERGNAGVAGVQHLQLGVVADVQGLQAAVFKDEQRDQIDVLGHVQRLDARAAHKQLRQGGVLGHVQAGEGGEARVQDAQVREILDALDALDGGLRVPLIQEQLLDPGQLQRVQTAVLVLIEVFLNVLAEGRVREVGGVDGQRDGRGLGREGDALPDHELIHPFVVFVVEDERVMDAAVLFLRGLRGQGRHQLRAGGHVQLGQLGKLGHVQILEVGILAEIERGQTALLCALKPEPLQLGVSGQVQAVQHGVVELQGGQLRQLAQIDAVGQLHIRKVQLPQCGQILQTCKALAFSDVQRLRALDLLVGQRAVAVPVARPPDKVAEIGVREVLRGDGQALGQVIGGTGDGDRQGR